MFNNWTSRTSTYLGTPTNSNLPRPQTRSPASFNGPKIFPRYSPPAAITSSSIPPLTPPPGECSFYSYFGKIKKATEVTPLHLAVLGASVEYEVPLEELLPKGAYEAYVPTDDDKVFSERRRELLISNDDASEALARRRRDIKLGHMYRFFQGVDMVKDYYPPESEGADGDAPLTPMDAEGGEPAAGPELVEEGGKGEKRKAEEEMDVGGVGKKGKGSESETSNDAGIVTRDADDKADADRGEQKFGMPDKFREEFVKNFVEPICWGYGVRIYPPRSPPKVAFQKSRFLVHLTNYIYHIPSLPAEARAGIVEGPVMGVQIRHENSFTRKDQPSPDDMEIDFDGGDNIMSDVVGVTREIAATLSLAQDRRKGPTDATKPAKVEKKVRYRAIGKPHPHLDDIFIITALHHHISISRVTVSAPYLRFLEKGRKPDFGHAFFGTEEGVGWDKLAIKKTQFWDLLCPRERVEAARGISGVMGWLVRGEGK